MKLGIPLGSLTACYWMKGCVRHLGAVKRWCRTLRLVRPWYSTAGRKGLLIVKS
jgi:hypothetical protein